MNLLQAIRGDNIERIKEILSTQRININATDNHNFTPLHHAVSVNSIGICRLLLKQKKIDPTIRSFEGFSPLFLAIQSNCHFEILELLIKSNRQLVNIQNNESVSCLHEAVKNRRLDIAKLLIENGASVNHLDLDSENCLHLAASNCDYNMIEYLLKETEIDPTAQNCDDMNPLCLLLIRSRNEPSEVVSACFHLMLESTYEKDILINNYSVEDLFRPAYLATVYSHSEIVKFIIFNIYSSHNSKYEFIKKLYESCTLDEDQEFLFYLLVFLHDKITKFDRYSFPRFSEINYFMCIRSVIYVLQKLLESKESVLLAFSLLDELEKIGMNIKVREFEDQIGVLLYERLTSSNFNAHHLENIDDLLLYFYNKGYNINTTIKSVLHSIAIAKDLQTELMMDSVIDVLKVLLPYNKNFFNDADSWKQISEYKNLNENIHKIVTWLNENYGNLLTNEILDMKIVYSLKHLCRNVILDNLKSHLRFTNLSKLKLPNVLLNYLNFK